MTRAFQCDACREFFTLDEVPFINPNDFKNCNGKSVRGSIPIQPISIVLSDAELNSRMRIHICPKCLDEILYKYFSRELPPDECQHTCIDCSYSRPPKNSAKFWGCLLTYAIILDPDVHSCNKWVPIRPKCLDEEVEKKEKCQ